MNAWWDDQQLDPGPMDQLPLEFEAFFTRWNDVFLKYANARLRSYHDAEEAVLEAAWRIHRKWDEMLGHANPMAYAHRILKGVVIDYWRDQARLAKCGQAAEYLAVQAGLDQIHRLASHEALDLAMEDLEAKSPRQAECVRLRHLVGLPYEEVAAMLDITPATAKHDTWTGMRYLKERPDRPAARVQGGATP